MELFALTKEDIQKILDYLASRPWKETNEYVVALLKAQAVNPVVAPNQAPTEPALAPTPKDA
jgi:hypothetical protein